MCTSAKEYRSSDTCSSIRFFQRGCESETINFQKGFEGFWRNWQFGECPGTSLRRVETGFGTCGRDLNVKVKYER